MTKQQKVDDILKTVHDAKRWYTREEFVGMVNQIWDALVGAEATAVDGAPTADVAVPK